MNTKHIFKKLILNLFLFCIALNTFAADYTINSWKVTSGDSSSGQLDLVMVSNINGDYLNIRVEQSDTYPSSGKVYIKSDSSSSSAATEQSISVDVNQTSFVTLSVKLSSSDNYPKDFYARYEGNDDSWAWAGPVTVSDNSDINSPPITSSGTAEITKICIRDVTCDDLNAIVAAGEQKIKVYFDTDGAAAGTIYYSYTNLETGDSFDCDDDSFDSDGSDSLYETSSNCLFEGNILGTTEYRLTARAEYEGGEDEMSTTIVVAPAEVDLPPPVVISPLLDPDFQKLAQHQSYYTANSPFANNSNFLGISDSGNAGDDDCQNVGDPINTATGAQNLAYMLLKVQGVVPVQFGIQYNSRLLADDLLGKGWGISNVSARLEQQDDGSMIIYWSQNQFNTFTQNTDGSYQSQQFGCRFDTLTQNTSDQSFTLKRKNKTYYHFDINGVLQRFSDAQGRELQFSYDTSGKLHKITEPVSGVFLQYAYQTDGLLQSVTDSLGREVRFNYDAQRLSSIKDAAGNTTQFTYNDNGQILAAVDGDGKQLFANTFDEQGRIATQDDGIAGNPLALTYTSLDDGTLQTTVTNPSGEKRVYTFSADYQLLSLQDESGHTVLQSTYNAAGKRTTSTDRNGLVTHYEYDEHGNLSKITAPGERISSLVYDSNNNLLNITDHAQRTVSFTYDTSNRMLSTTDTEGLVTTYTYMADGQVASVTRPNEAVTTFEYSNGLPTRITDAEGRSFSLAYDAAGRLVTVRDADGNATELVYDAVNQVVAIKDALNRQLRMNYDVRGNVLDVTDAKGHTTRFEYDANGNRTAVIDALEQTTRYGYDANNRVVQITDAANHSSTLAYDATGRLLSVVDALGNTRRLNYDAAGNLTAQTDALGKTVAQYAYDNLQRLVAVTDALDNRVQFEYDELDNVVKSINPLAQVHQYQYDSKNRLQAAIDALGGSSTQAFGVDGLRKQFKDPNGNLTTLQHNQVGQITALTLHNGDQMQYAYNPLGLLDKVINARGQARTFSYDAVGRLTGWQDAEGSVNISYDANDNIVAISDGVSEIGYEYDALDRVVKRSDGDTVLLFAYDAVGHLQRLTYPDGKVVEYAYDAVGRLLSVTDWAQRVTRYSYDANGRLVLTEYANGSRESHSYDAAGQLLEKRIENVAGGLIVQYNYVYDAAGNVVDEQLAPESVAVMLESLSLEMSPLAFTYVEANRLVTANESAVEFDADGNMVAGMLNGQAATFGFDSQNRLTEVNGTMRYGYDLENNRVAVVRNGAETRYVVNPVARLSQTLGRIEADGTQTWYVYGLGLIAEQQGEVYQVYHFDLRGSTVALSDAQGIEQARFYYSAFGGLLGDPASVDTPFLYNGRDGVMTDDNGLYYMRARFYSPEIRRFVNQDPLLGFVADGQTLNRYAYVTGNPVSFVDPFGLWAGYDDAAAIIGGALAGVAGQFIANILLGDNYNPGWESYVGSAIGGAVTAELALYIVPTLGGVGNALAGGVGAAIESLITQTLEILGPKGLLLFEPKAASISMFTGLINQNDFDTLEAEFDWNSFGINVALGVTGGALSNYIPSPSSGKGGISAIKKQMNTEARKLVLGLYQSAYKKVTPKTMGKMISAQFIEDLLMAVILPIVGNSFSSEPCGSGGGGGGGR